MAGFSLAAADVERGAVATFQHKIVSPLPRKRYNYWTWLPSRRGATGLDTLILGDSYCDHYDMSFECWPSLLARQGERSSLNLSCGGARLGACRQQLETASRVSAELGLAPSAQTLVIVHAGGNDFLQALIFPPFLALLVVDILFLAVARSRSRRVSAAAMPTGSYAGLGMRWLGLQMRWLVAALHARGYRRVLVTGPPICSALPLGRLVITLLTLGLGGSAFVDATLRDLGQIVTSGLRDETLPRVAAELPDMRLSFFDGGGALAELATAAAEERHGVLSTLGLLAARRRPTPRTFFWRDGHHPTAMVHRELAARCESGMRTAAAAPADGHGAAAAEVSHIAPHTCASAAPSAASMEERARLR